MKAQLAKPRRSILRWPLVWTWRGATLVSNRMGIIASLAVGAVMMAVGFFLTSTLIGALIGIPLFALGLLLFMRGVIYSTNLFI